MKRIFNSCLIVLNVIFFLFIFFTGCSKPSAPETGTAGNGSTGTAAEFTDTGSNETTISENGYTGTGKAEIDAAEAIDAGSDNYVIMRQNMVQEQIVARGINDEKVIDTMLKVPRHLFVSENQWGNAYDDNPLPIGMGQTISQPYIVALMTESLILSGDEKVLEIGTGSGYQAAVLSEIVRQVYTVEIIPELYEKAKKSLAGYKNINISNHDGYYGWEEFAPFDRIIVTAAPDHIPQPLISQLKDGGIMVIPVGPPGWNQVLWKVDKEDGEIITEKILDVIFVPLTGGTQENS